MALDPSISLDVRPPQFNVQIPQPLQQFGQILTLQNLMQQQQMFPLELQTKKLGLDQAQLAYRQALGLANLFANPGTDTTQTPIAPAVTPAPAPPAAQPGTFVLGQGQSGAPVHSLDGGANWADSITGAPYGGPRYGETPIPAVPLGAMDITPPTAMPPVSAPAPVSGGPPAPAPVASAPALPSGGLPGLPSWQRMIQVGGASAFPWIKNINEAQKSQLEVEGKQLENAQGRSKDMARILNGMVDNESKNRLLPEAAAKGYITGDEARQFYNMDFNDPRFQARKDSASQQALTYDQTVDLGIKRNKEARDQNKEVRDWVDFHNKQFEQEVSDFKGQVGALTDPAQFGPLLATKSDRLKAMYGGLVGQPLNDIKVWTGAGKVGETVSKPQSVLQSEVAQTAAKTGAETTARLGAEDVRYQALAEQVKKDPAMWPTLNMEQQNHVGPLLQQGFPYTTKLETGEASNLYTMQKNLNDISKLNQEFASGKYDWITGPFLGSAVKDSRYIPGISAEAKGLGAKLAIVEATVGDLIKGGVLRESDREAYKAMFPSQTDTTENIKAKLGALTERLQGDLDTYKGILRSQRRLLPGETPGAAPAGQGTAPTAPTAPTSSGMGPFPGSRLLRSPQGPGQTPAPVPPAVSAQLTGKPSGTYDLRNKTTKQIEHWFVDANGNLRQVP